MAIKQKLISDQCQLSAHIFRGGEKTMCSENLMPSTLFLAETSVKTSSFLEELFNSTMNALHLVGNPALCRLLDIHSDSVVRVWRYHFVLLLSPMTGTEERL